MKINKKKMGIGVLLGVAIVGFFTLFSMQGMRANTSDVTPVADVSTGATTLTRSDFNDNFTLAGAVGMRYQVGGAFNPIGPALTDAQMKARYDEETGIVTLTPNRNDWSGNFTLNNRISTEHPFKLKGAIYLGDRTDADWRDTDYGANGGTPSGGADGIGFAFHPEEVGRVGFTGANMGIGGLKGAIGYKFDTYWNTAQQSNEDDNHRLGWETDPDNKGAHNGNPFGAFIETTTELTPANTPLLNSGRTVPFATEAGFGVADWNQLAWLDTSKILQNSGPNRRIEIGDDPSGNPVQGPTRRDTPDYGYDANDRLSRLSKDNTTGFENIIYDYQPETSSKGMLSIYLVHGITSNPIQANALTEVGVTYDLIGQKEIDSTDSLALAVSASTGAFRNLQQFRFDSFQYSAVKRLTLDKIWDDNSNANGLRPTTLKVQIWANLKATQTKEAVRLPYKTPIELTEVTNWHYVYDNLPKFNNEGREIFYDVTEIPVPGYETSLQSLNDESNPDVHFEISNKLQDPLALSGEKIWLDNGDTVSRPDHITVQLWRKENGHERQVKYNELATGYQNFYGPVNPNDFVTQETDADQNWTYTFSYLHGVEVVSGHQQGIQYFFKEVLPGNYRYKYEVQVIGRDIVNTPTLEEKTSLIVQKVWDDTGHEKNRPGSIKVQLLSNKKAYGEPFIITVQEDWRHEFKDLPLRDGRGNEISYSIQEIKTPNHYQSQITQKNNSVTLTNKFVQDESNNGGGYEKDKDKDKDKGSNTNSSGNDKKDEEEQNLPGVGQQSEFWLILIGVSLLFLITLFRIYKRKKDKENGK